MGPAQWVRFCSLSLDPDRIEMEFLILSKRQDLLPLSTRRSLYLEGQLLQWYTLESAASLGQSLGGTGSLPLGNPFQQSPAMASHCQQDLSRIKRKAESGREEPVRLMHCSRFRNAEGKAR